MPRMVRICRYPVKGMSAEFLTETTVAPGGTIPLDRTFALVRPNAPIDPDRPQWIGKRGCLALMTDERLALLTVRYDDARSRITIDQAGARVVDADVGTGAGRTAVEAFFEGFMGPGLGGRPRLVQADGVAFTDNPEKYLSLINLGSVADLGRRMEHELDPRRFRGNLYVDGLEPWAEFDWVGATAVAGEVRFDVVARIDRCAATNVDPDRGVQDLNVPLALRRAYDHIDCGVFLKVVSGGAIAVGDTIDVV